MYNSPIDDFLWELFLIPSVTSGRLDDRRWNSWRANDKSIAQFNSTKLARRWRGENYGRLWKLWRWNKPCSDFPEDPHTTEISKGLFLLYCFFSLSIKEFQWGRYCLKRDTTPISLFPIKSLKYLMHNLERKHCNSINSKTYLGIPRYIIIYNDLCVLKILYFLFYLHVQFWNAEEFAF